MPITAIHPGEHLVEELEALGMSAAELARQLKVPPRPTVSQESSTGSVPSLVTQPYAWAISSEPARSFG